MISQEIIATASNLAVEETSEKRLLLRIDTKGFLAFLEE